MQKLITSANGNGKQTNHSEVAGYRMLVDRITVMFSHINIVSKQSLRKYIALRYVTNVKQLSESAACKSKYPFMGAPYAFKLCNIAAENNIGMILNAFVQTPQHQLVIVGNWNKTEYSKSIKKTFAIFPNIHMLDLIDDQNELDMLRANSFAHIHGDEPGSADAALLEAMFMGLPVISIATANNKVITENKALYFNSAHDLAFILNYTRIGEFQRVGSAMQETALHRYTWRLIAAKYKYLFSRLIKTQNNSKASCQSTNQRASLRFDMGY